MIHHQRLSAFLLCMKVSLCDIFGTTTKAPREAVLICERQMCATKTAFPMRTFTQSSKSSCPFLSPAGRKTAIAPHFPAFLFVDSHAADSDTAARLLHCGRFTHRRPLAAPRLIPILPPACCTAADSGTAATCSTAADSAAPQLILLLPPGAAAFPPPRSAAWQGKHALWSQGPG